MYRFVGTLQPDDLRAIATQLYAEMLCSGYTAVAEFHYLHHDVDGRPYADPAEMSRAVAEAARAAGIGQTLLPVLYASGGFGGKPAGEGQRRFLHRVDDYLRLVATLERAYRDDPQIRVGIAPHSLRAVPPRRCARRWSAWTPSTRMPPSTSISPSRPRRSRTASPGRPSARSTGCCSTPPWGRAGAWSTPPT